MYKVGVMVVLDNGICAIIEEIDEVNQSLYVTDKDGTEYVVSFQNPIVVYN